MKYKLGGWYESKSQVRADFGEYRKGILTDSRRTAIIYNYQGARRVHYGDYFDPSTGTLRYIGEGKKPEDQTLNARNQRLIDLVGAAKTVDLFLDCGDIFKPKKLLYGGKWLVTRYSFEVIEDRNAYAFTLTPETLETIDFLRFTFFDTQHLAFEKALQAFASARNTLYASFPEVMRVRDNVVGEIGEYFAVKALNASERNSVIRLVSGVKNIDAVQINNGRTYAIKTIGKIPQTTSNIWASSPEAAVSDFIIVVIDHSLLTPIKILRMSARKAMKFMREDKYQGSQKLLINKDFVRSADVLPNGCD